LSRKTLAAKAKQEQSRSMDRQRQRTQASQGRFFFAVGALCLAVGACANSRPIILDTTERIPPPSEREGASANDVFLRKPWEIWRVPSGNARYHREAFMLLPDETRSFKAADVSVYAADGSDVRVDYVSIELGSNLQSHASVSVFVYRAPGSLDGEWTSVVDRVKQKYAGARSGEAFPLPEKHPATTKQMAFIALADSGDKTSDTFVQVTLFHQGEWAVRYEIACPLTDVAAARDITRSFLGSLRARE
jgi:hypothetical protein